MTNAWIDFETYSAKNIKTAGGMAYARHDSTNPICLGWAIDDKPVSLWTPREPEPTELFEAISNGAFIYAHNMKFDYRIWLYKMLKDFNWPEVHIDQCVDSQALCATYGLPLSLDAAGTAMQITMQKSATGKALIKLLCSPNKKGGQPMYNDPVYQARFQEFFAYCKRDIEAMRELVTTKLPRSFLIKQEHKVWKITHKMNSNGLPIAYDEVVAIRERLTQYIEKEMVKVPLYTKGVVDKITQTVKLAQWCRDNGYDIPNLTAATVEESLEDPSCPDNVRRVLELRQELGKSSVAKFTKLIDQAIPDEDGQYWIYDNLEFHGAGTGRWSGRGFQMHNLPRFKLKEPEVYIQKFLDGSEIANPVGIAKGLIRPMIKAPKQHKLFVLDYNSIENKLLHWLANDQETLTDFRNGIDQYATMAAARYKKTYAYIKEGHNNHDPECSSMRQMGKVIVLGAGFGMGSDTFVKTAKRQFGMIVSDEEASQAIFAYREKYFLVKKLWNDLKTAAVRAVLTGQRQTVHLITFGLAVVNDISWLAMRLPSGKCVYYCSPKVEARHIPKFEHMGKVPTITHLGRHPKTGKWMRIALIPGRITENCLAEGTKVLTDKGWVNIENITLQHKVHDGETLVSHTGLISQGTQPCIAIDGVFMTLDQEVLQHDGTWKTASQCKRQNWTDLWRPNNHIIQPFTPWTRGYVELLMQVRKYSYSKLGRTYENREKRFSTSKLWLSSSRIFSRTIQKQSTESKERRSSLQPIQCMAINDCSMHFTNSSSLGSLWRTWYSCRPKLVNFRNLLERYGSRLRTKFNSGASRQRKGLQYRQLLLGYARRAREQYAIYVLDRLTNRANNGSSSGETIWRSKVNNSLLDNNWTSYRTFDIANAGPKQRFIVQGVEGPFVVHNCVQATAREVMAQGLLNVDEKMPEMKLIGSVHDECLGLVHENNITDDTLPKFNRLLCDIPWAKDCPITADGFIADRYKKD